MAHDKKKVENEDELDEDKTLNESDEESDDDDIDFSLDDEDDEEDGDEDSPDEDDDEEDDGASDDETLEEEDLNDPEKRKAALRKLKEAESALKQKQMWRKRALKAGWKKDQQPEGKPSAKPQAKKSAEADEEARRSNERIEFRIDHPDIPRRMVNEIEKFAKANGVSLERALRSPIVKRFVNDKELKERLSKASPSSRHRPSRTPEPKDWSRATPEEVAAHAAEVRRRKASR